MENGNKVLKRIVGTVEQEYEPTTAEEKQDRRNEKKAKATLLMALPNKDQLKFHSFQDAKLLIEAIEKRYRGNKESKNVQRTLLKQQYENFAALSSETMDQTFDSTNNTIITNKADDIAHGVSTTHTKGNGVNLDNLCDAVIVAFLASQPNSPQLAQEDLEQLHPDDLEEMDLQWEMAMLTIRAKRFIKRTWRKLDINGQRVSFDKSKVECYNYHKHGHFARECSYQAEEEQPINHAVIAFTSSGSSSSSDSGVDSCSKTCMKAYATPKEQYDNLSSDYKKSQCNLLSYKVGLELVEARLVYYKKNEAVFEESIKVLKLEVRLRDNALDEYKMNLEKAETERDHFKKGLGYDAATAASPAVEGFVNLTDKSGSDKAYYAVPPPLSRNSIPGKPDVTFIDEIVESENMDVTTVILPNNVKTVENKGVSNTVKSNAVRTSNTSAPIIKD
ncbi:ribonuclease H-like domain-containing protein [Tanacetum coccineum]|uniref:Ribonuclease H-like domain-containing protein n=1 Tax=Tanacetum coccineum TaxID=301880 RepID=A0ABQ4WRT4_9ASTR